MQFISATKQERVRAEGERRTAKRDRSAQQGQHVSDSKDRQRERKAGGQGKARQGKASSQRATQRNATQLKQATQRKHPQPQAPHRHPPPINPTPKDNSFHADGMQACKERCGREEGDKGGGERRRVPIHKTRPQTERVIREAQQKRGLANAAVADEHQLDQIVICTRALAPGSCHLVRTTQQNTAATQQRGNRIK